jgi:hypothetical protein
MTEKRKSKPKDSPGENIQKEPQGSKK